MSLNTVRLQGVSKCLYGENKSEIEGKKDRYKRMKISLPCAQIWFRQSPW